MAYSKEQYEEEKQKGLRTATGAKKLTRLTPRHRQVITLHLEGRKGVEIAAMMGMNQGWVSNVLHDPLVVEEIQRNLELQKMELEALAGDAIDAVRTGLQQQDLGLKLKSVDRFTKLRTAMGSETKQETAEDVAQRLLQAIQVNGNLNVQINTHTREHEE